MGVTLGTLLEDIGGIAPRYLAALKRLNIKTVRDLLYHFPSRYEDYSRVRRIAELELREETTVRGEVYEVRGRRTWGRTRYVTEAVIVDGEDSIRAVWWNQPYLAHTLRPGTGINIAGKVSANEKGELYFSNPAFELITNYDLSATTHTARIVPIYPETRGLTSKGIRYVLRPILESADAEEFIPEETLKQEKLPALGAALRRVHLPEELAEAEAAKMRFAFEDLFLLELANVRERARLAKERAPTITLTSKHREEFVTALPFALTASQKQSLGEIFADLAKPTPMNRLLQGDVGSGKTVIAALAARAAAESGFQTVFMAPTEILAHQHYETFKKFFPDFERGVALITANEMHLFLGDGLERGAKKTELQSAVRGGKVSVAIGTHALIAESNGQGVRSKGRLEFKNLGLVIIDEQHRFGVAQRAVLVQNRDSTIHNSKLVIPHFLSMSATPIPRTLALTLFGNLDVSQISELPKDRKEIVTKVVAPADRFKAYAFIKEFVKRGRQAFVICPRIEVANEHELTANNTNNIRGIRERIREYSLLEAKNVIEEYQKLSKEIFPDLRVGMLHGKLGAREKAESMKKFAEGAIDILVATSVVEVGVDVPNATIMMVEGAERFGLAQLYQFRGRVGRGVHQSFCFLFSESPSETARKRLAAVARAKNGFELAEEDLKLRGPGEFLGTVQTGMPDIAMKALMHPTLIPPARRAAGEILARDPALTAHPALKERLAKFAKAVHLE